MKTNVLKSLLAIAAVGGLAPTTAAELLTDGKSWLIGMVHYNHAVPGTDYITLSRIEVVGDTIVGEKACKKLHSYAVNNEADKATIIALEDGGRVYGCIPIDGEEPWIYPMLDMSLKEVGDKASLSFDGQTSDEAFYQVAAVNTLTVDGREFRELVMKDNTNRHVNCWVDGVGGAIDNWLTIFPSPTCLSGGSFSYMIACYQDGECIFTQDDFSTSGKPSRSMPEIFSAGKSWIYEQDYIDIRNDNSILTRQFKVEVMGDSVVGKVLCKNLRRTCLTDNEVAPDNIGVFEFGRSVYSVEADGKIIAPLMRFNYTVNESLSCWDYGSEEYVPEQSSLKLKEINKLSVNGVERSEYVLVENSNPETVVNSWVEGIGSATDVYVTRWPQPTSDVYPSGPARMIACYQNGECIFTGEDFTHPVAGINEVNAEAEADRTATYFDLTGRKVARPVKGRIYVEHSRNGYQQIIY